MDQTAGALVVPPPGRDRPPAGVVGPVAWLRANLFGSWWSTAVTLLLGYLIIRWGLTFFDWAVLDAIWTVPDQRARPAGRQLAAPPAPPARAGR